ncbi:unnamed protein product [Rotaria sp. Silwood1]|nr:unnamed protein product [Rotaria sp. Silwood1]CAF1562550.1 unnamed protein product [Rotaria sp. Silwood1]CAF1562952.1 unnamed protein product [Rotaria sp. Silwood1]
MTGTKLFFDPGPGPSKILFFGPSPGPGPVKNIVESFTTTAYHFTVEEENDEFKWNDSISTLYNNTNGTDSSIVTNYDPYLHGEYLQDVNNSTFFTSKTIVQEEELTSSNSSNYLNRDNRKTFESFTIQTEDHMNNWYN